MISNPSFIVFCGGMFAAKTSKLLMTLDRFKHQNKRIVAFKPRVDNRYSESEIVTHSGWKHPAVLVDEGLDVLKHLTDAAEVPDVVAVDEMFMIPKVAEVLIWLYQRGTTIVVSTLDVSHAGKPFDEVTKVLPFATQVEKCTAVCTVCGRDAHYTHRKVQVDDEIQIGGSEAYEPRCLAHFVPLNKMEEVLRGHNA